MNEINGNKTKLIGIETFLRKNLINFVKTHLTKKKNNIVGLDEINMELPNVFKEFK